MFTLQQRGMGSSTIVLAAILLGLALPQRAVAEPPCEPQWAEGFGVPGVNGNVYAMTVLDDGSGPALYAGGTFTTAGGVSANLIAKWDGSAWSPLGSGMSGGSLQEVSALTVFDDGSGPALYAGGNFTTAGGAATNYIAKWNGSTWAPLGSGVNSWVYALTVFDDGSGPALYAGGQFTTAGGVTVNRIAKWDGRAWSPLGSGMNSAVYALTAFYNGGSRGLFVGGGFTSAGGILSARIAKWGCLSTQCPGDVDGDGAIGQLDLNLVLAAFGACSGDLGYSRAADLDGDGCIGQLDLDTLLASFGEPCGAP